MATAAVNALSSHLLVSNSGTSHTPPNLSYITPLSSSSFYANSSPLCYSEKNALNLRKTSFRCTRATVTSEAPKTQEQKKKKKGVYDIQTLTGWLLRQEQSGVIDSELTIVLSSISLACKQIASLVQRAGISNLTGVQGATNVQGEDQKKLDVVSNEVPIYILKLFF